jgi:hypothetical protein
MHNFNIQIPTVLTIYKVKNQIRGVKGTKESYKNLLGNKDHEMTKEKKIH